MVMRKKNIDASGGYDKGEDNIFEEDYIPEKHSCKFLIVGIVVFIWGR